MVFAFFAFPPFPPFAFKFRVRGQGYTTVGGLVFGLLGHEPEIGDAVEIGHLDLKVTQLQGKRVKTLSVKKAKR